MVDLDVRLLKDYQKPKTNCVPVTLLLAAVVYYPGLSQEPFLKISAGRVIVDDGLKLKIRIYEIHCHCIDYRP